MSHLDEGVIHALLDGEIPSAELPPIQAHLGTCAECRARLAGEQELLATSDRLIELIEVPAAAAPVPRKRSPLVRRTWPRDVAWAATVVLAAGLGYSARGSMGASPVKETSAPAPLKGLQNAAEERKATRPPASLGRTNEPAKPAARDAAPAGRAREGRVALDSVATEKPAVGARVAAAGPPVQQPESIPAPPATPPAPAVQLRAAKRLGAEPNRLEELVVTSADAQSGKLAASSAITLPDAVRRLGGSLRLIEGLIPERLEALGPAVRVVYLTRFGDLVLSQELENGTVRHTLIPPRGFPADSLERLRARVRE
jgi:hypothetical protein